MSFCTCGQSTYELTAPQLILSPIENAIELIADRCAKLRTELETNPPRLNSLHQVIQGSVVPSASLSLSAASLAFSRI
jgi:hypothetical protein